MDSNDNKEGSSREKGKQITLDLLALMVLNTITTAITIVAALLLPNVKEGIGKWITIAIIVGGILALLASYTLFEGRLKKIVVMEKVKDVPVVSRDRVEDEAETS